jgi:aminoglycoside 6'-N-acetyltransferase
MTMREGRDKAVLRGRLVVLRPLGESDRGRLLEILAEPSVTAWWGGKPSEDVVRDMLAGEDTVAYGIERDGELIGGIQFYEESEPEYRHASIDLFVGTAHQDRGLGTDAVRTLARYLFEERGHHRLTIDPAAANARAIRAYQRVGFRLVGVMRQYERGADGSFHDSLLMDMLVGELLD